MLKNRLLYVAGVPAAILFHIFYFGWYSWYLLVLVLCLPWFVLLLSLPAMLQTRLKLTMPEQCTVVDTAFLLFSVRYGRRKFLQPLHLKLRVKNTVDGKMVTHKHLKSAEGQIPLNTHLCGAIQCSAAGSRVYDYLGLFGLPVRGSQSRELLVLPRPVPPDPLPDLTHFSVGRRKPKPGGGYSEEHELREYREGDPLREIHWKLSAKTDRMIVREAQELIRERVLLTFDLPNSAERLDYVLSRLMWLSQWMLQQKTVHEICWQDTSGQQRVTVETEEDLQDALRRILSRQLPVKTLSPDEMCPAGAWWHYHLRAEEVQP